MITFGLGALLLISTISAIPYPSADVKSAVIHNNKNLPVRCTISWAGIDGPLEIKDTITIESKQSKTVNGRDINMGSYTAFARISTIQCGAFSLNAPFHANRMVKALWQFRVEEDRLLSVGPNPLDS